MKPLQIRSRPNPCCYLCGSEGRVVYHDLPDKLFHTPGTWSSKVCRNPGCGLVWLDPVPLEQDIAKAYIKYYTHVNAIIGDAAETGTAPVTSSNVLSFLHPLRRDRERLSRMYLDDCPPGRLLDVGCGSGLRLAKMRDIGWDVVGQDVDPQAVSGARQTFGVEVHLGRLENIAFPENSFDAITLNHVIEHVHDPVELLRQCRRLLKIGGQLVIVTPNSASFGHKRFGASWLGLDAPRHIHVFSRKTLTQAVNKAGLTVCRSWTTAANATTFGRGSMMINDGRTDDANWETKPLTRARALSYLYRSMLELARDADSGEECVLRATH